MQITWRRPGDVPHFFADHRRRFAADVGVNFIKHQHRDLVLLRQHRFEREHDARHFARGSDGAQGPGRFAGIRGELEINFIQAGNGIGRKGIRRLDGNFKVALLKAQVVQLFHGGFGEPGTGFAPLRGQIPARFPKFGGQFFPLAS